MDETGFYNENGVMITSTRAVFGDQTYAMNLVTSVSLSEDPPSRTGGIVLLIGLIIIIMGGCVSSTDSSGIGQYILGGLITAWGVYILLTTKPSYSVMVITAAGEMRALSSKDLSTVQAIVDALNNAIISRG